MPGPKRPLRRPENWRRRIAADERDSMFKPSVRLNPSRVQDYRNSEQTLRDQASIEIRSMLNKWASIFRGDPVEAHQQGLERLGRMGQRSRRLGAARRQVATLRQKENRENYLARESGRRSQRPMPLARMSKPRAE